jgi:hypothetical protein
MGTAEDVEKWRWPSLTKEESRKQVAIVSHPLKHHLERRANRLHVRLHVGGALAELPPAVPRLRPVLLATRFDVSVRVMKAFQLGEYLRLIRQHRITRLRTVPLVMVTLSKRPRAAECDLGSVGEILCGAAPLGRHLHDEMEQRFGVRIT